MYELHFRDTSIVSETVAKVTSSQKRPFTIARIAEAVNLGTRLADRERLLPAELDAALSARSRAHSIASSGHNTKAGDGTRFVPVFPLDRLFPGAFYLESVDAMGARVYGQRPKDVAARARGGPLAPSLNGEAIGEETAATMTSASGTTSVEEGDETRRLEFDGGAPATSDCAVNGAGVKVATTIGTTAVADIPAVAREGRGKAGEVLELPRVVVTGVACGLPGQEKVFEEDNLARLLEGKECVKRLNAASMKALVEKNVVQVFSVGMGDLVFLCNFSSVFFKNIFRIQKNPPPVHALAIPRYCMALVFHC